MRAKTAPSFARSLISGTPPPSSTLSTELSPAREEDAPHHRRTLFFLGHAHTTNLESDWLWKSDAQPWLG